MWKDRNSFLKSIYSLLKPNGKVLLVNMGDGKEERQTDTTKAFELAERNLRSGEQINVASTSFRCVNVDYHGERA
ncbi:hypothetical protein PV797_02325 [Clostridiaceae bacterium M8S5]|nr:hypothetical protein PV797_02325 [Clostridiaceae bacterium M8S5]